FIVDKAEDGEKVLELIKENKPDIIIIDDMLPVMTGWQVVKTLKNDESYKKYADIPIIMLSDMAEPQAIVEGFDIGVDDYIKKPFSFAIVYARIRAALRNRDLLYKKAQGERAISLIKSLRHTVVFLEDHLVLPAERLKSAIDEFNKNDIIDKDKFIPLFNNNIDKIVAVVSSISDRITEIKKGEIELDDMNVDIFNLEEEYRKHLKNLQSKG
ncbi:MAG: response regulator, partial [Spirochaetaceae bacterium]|nr:response regulator [Spirochaetaceae bacterium]